MSKSVESSLDFTNPANLQLAIYRPPQSTITIIYTSITGPIYPTGPINNIVINNIYPLNNIEPIHTINEITIGPIITQQNTILFFIDFLIYLIRRRHR